MSHFDNFITAMIILNIIVMSMEFYRMPDLFEQALDISQYTFACVFLLECLLKLAAYRLRYYVPCLRPQPSCASPCFLPSKARYSSPPPLRLEFMVRHVVAARGRRSGAELQACTVV